MGRIHEHIGFLGNEYRRDPEQQVFTGPGPLVADRLALRRRWSPAPSSGQCGGFVHKFGGVVRDIQAKRDQVSGGVFGSIWTRYSSAARDRWEAAYTTAIPREFHRAP